jgi:addiction module RelE/StbE family toxin
MTTRWTPTAARDLEDVHDYIARDNEEAAIATIERILAGIDALGRHPQLGRKGRVGGTRELVISPYIAVYRVAKDAVEIHAVLHSARRWPDRL